MDVSLEIRYTPEQVAKHFHRSVATVTRWVREGRLTAINLGGGRHGPYVFRPEDLAEFERRSATQNGNDQETDQPSDERSKEHET